MRQIPALAFSALLLSGALARGEEHGGKIDWVRDPQFGLMKARMEQRVAMLYFTATW